MAAKRWTDRPTDGAVGAAAAAAVLSTVVVAASLAPAAQLLPVDEAAQRPAFFSFRAQLQEAVARHDVDAVMAVVHPNIKASFGGDDDSAAFRRMWQPESPDSELWAKLSAVLALGGTFQADGTFVAPYTFSRWPQPFDGFEHVALVAADVRVRDAPQPDGAVITTMSFAILPLARTTTPEVEGWTAVRVDGTRIGYVATRLARSPIDYRAMFSLTNGRWQMMLFLAGD